MGRIYGRKCCNALREGERWVDGGDSRVGSRGWKVRHEMNRDTCGGKIGTNYDII